MICSMAGGTIISIAYGIEVLQENDPYIEHAERAIKPLVIAGVPGTFLVDTFPILKRVPDWIPGASFKHKAKAWRELSQAMVEVPFDAAKRKIVSILSRYLFGGNPF